MELEDTDMIPPVEIVCWKHYLQTKGGKQASRTSSYAGLINIMTM